jgi:hypothetical protein
MRYGGRQDKTGIQGALNVQDGHLFQRLDQFPAATPAAFRCDDTVVAQPAKRTANDHRIGVEHLCDPF